MYRQFTINHFRGFADLSLDSLKQVNLIGGLNGSGKTTLLEAIFIHAGAPNASLVLATNAMRGLVFFDLAGVRPPSEVIRYSFQNLDLSIPIEFKSIDDSSQTRQTEISPSMGNAVSIASFQQPPTGAPFLPGLPPTISISPAILTYREQGQKSREHRLWLHQRGGEVLSTVDPPFPPLLFNCVFIRPAAALTQEDLERYSVLRRAGQQDLLISALQLLHPSVSRLEVLPLGGPSILHADVGTGAPLPISLLGDGSVQITKILLSIGAASGGIALLDEVGFGIHHTVQERLWDVISIAAATFKTQVFATSHSFETVVAAHNAFSKKDDYVRFQYLRLDKRSEPHGLTYSIEPVVYNRQQLESAIDKGFEVR